MPPRFDSDAATLELAVADLLDTKLLRSLGFAHRGGYERMWLGQAIHSRYQEQALEEDPTYRREVTVRHSFDHRGFRVTIQGRIDGLRKEDEDTLVVEEIKSVRRSTQLAPATREIYQRQAALYAWLLAREETPDAMDEERIQAELVLIEIGGEQVDREEVPLDFRQLTAEVKRRINALIRAHQSEIEAQGLRRGAGERLAFPYPLLRPGQEEIIDAASAALEAGEHLMVEATTGIGKTVATLYPALRFALTHNKRVFILTAKNLQQEMATAVLQLLNRDDAFRALRLRAKRRMCANDQVLCHEEYCPYAKDYHQKIQQTGVVSRLLEVHPTLLPDDIYDTARRAQVCPFEVSLELTSQVQVTVCDYNYAFDPYVGLRDFAAESRLDNTLLLVDEIHNLVDRGRGYYSPHLSAQAARQAGEEAGLGVAPIHLEISRLCRHLEGLIAETVTDAEPPGAPDSWALEQSMPEDELWQLRSRFDRAFIDYLEYRRETRTLTADDLFVDLYFSLLKFLNAMILEGDAFSHYVERTGRDERLCILCKDPSRFLGQVINRCHSVIGLSATLSPHEFYRDLLGFDPSRTSPLRLANPFPPEKRQVVVDTSVATTYKERPTYYPRIAESLSRFAESVPGNCLALFPSYRFLAEVAGYMALERKRVLVQQQSDGERQRQEILDTLRSAIYGDILLLAVAGGVFAEGVDYPGDMLKAVAVVGPCLPALTLEQELLKAYYDERFDKGFEYAFVVPGMTRVIQAAGRLIRSAEDEGVIALLDRRFLRYPYRQHLPADWTPEGGTKHLAGDPSEAARAFFARSGSRD